MLAGLLYLGGLALTLGRAVPVPPEAALLLLATVLLELAGGASALYLGVALAPGLGPVWTVLLLTLGMATRMVFRRARLEDVAGEVLPVLAATLPLALLGPGLPRWGQVLLVVDLYLPVALHLKRPASFPRALVSCGLAVALGGTLGQGWMTVLALLAAAALVPSLRASAPAQAPAPPREITPSRRRLEDELRHELEKSRHDYVLLEEATLELGASSSLPLCLENLVCRLSSMVDCQSAVVFLDKEGRLLPSAFRSPFREQLANVELTGLNEQLVEQAWKTRAPASRSQGPGGALFASEGSAVALPLGSLGVVYVGRAPNFPLASEELRLITLLTNQAAVAASSLLLRDEQQRALELYQESCRRLETWAEGLSQLVEGARAASSTLDSRAILDVLVDKTLESVPCPSLALFVGQELVRARPPELGLAYAERMHPQIGPALKSGRPLALDGRWQPLQEGEESLLLVPLMAESGAVGVLCLGRVEKEAFPRHQQDLLFMLACHAALALDNARHYQDLSDALRRLQESEVQLVQSSKLAAVGQLAAGVAHELNTPLNSILLAAETASELVESAPERARKHLDLTVRSGLRARDIVAKLLYYARDAREGKVQADLNQVVRDTLELYGQQLRLSGLEVECELGELPRASMCPNEIQQVLVNLLLNARDVMPTGGKVWVRTRHLAPWLELEVEDSGPGVPGELTEKIFDPFFTTKPVGQGTGLGLSVSRQILERHEGTLRLEDSQRGARFVLALPAS